MRFEGSLVLAMTLAWAVSASAQISPGRLARAHEDLEGSLNCNKCHTGRAETMSTKCLDCHTEIASLQKLGRGLHARVTSKACTECHPDHAGREFDLISWEEGSPGKFDHRRSGWPLEGKHAKVACRDCHRPALQKSSVKPKIRHRPADTSWLGLETRCVSCHEDAHQGTLASACESCHTLAGWKPASRFDHARTAYSLTGKHMAVACAKCHFGSPPKTGVPGPSPGEVVDLKRFKPVSHHECSACHQDPHKGSLGGTCSSCHLTPSFQQINSKSFRHDKTRFPLLGAHAAVACEKCHVKAGVKPLFAACRDCHAEAHGNQFSRQQDKDACESCHTVKGWRPATFGAAEHALLRLPLEGRHAEIECRACHSGGTAPAVELGSAKVRLTWSNPACEQCHVDPHRGRWSGAAGGCRSCHDERSFHRARVDAVMHASFAYPLEGAHRALPCVACHPELNHKPAPSTLVASPAGVPALLFDQKRSACRDCHANPHGAAFDGASAKNCTDCHDANTFVPAVRFDHDRDSRFKLQGAHAQVPCRRCHPTATGQDGKQFVVYRPLDTACRSCHAGSSAKAVVPGTGGVQ